MSVAQGETKPLKQTPLHDLHVAQGGRMVAFAGYAMPVQYRGGVIAEHKHTRECAGLFDVSHMGQARLHGPDREAVARALERLVPADVSGLAPGRQRYTQLLNEEGGIVDDLMMARFAHGDGGECLHLVVNAARKDADYRHLRERLPDGIRLAPLEDRALLALQGPQAATVLERLVPGADALAFMAAGSFRWNGLPLDITRSGYTGEDGFEMSLAADAARTFAEALLAEPEVALAGLGARDSLRLEAGLCLYGQDIDETTSPVEAGLEWSIPQRRRRSGGFTGAERVLRELAEGPSRRRVGMRPATRQPARAGAEVRSRDGSAIGIVTSGGFSPSLNAPVAMGYVAAACSKEGTPLDLVVRDKPLPAEVARLPFVPHGYKR